MATRSQIHKKEQTLSAWIETRQKILTASSKLTKAQQDQVFLGIWSIKDLLAHLTGWDHTNFAAAKRVMKGLTPTFYQYRDRDWQTYNAILVKKYRQDSFPDSLAELEVFQQKLLIFLKKLPPEVFGKDFGARFRGYKITIQRLLEAETKDEQTHFEQITCFFHVPK